MTSLDWIEIHTSEAWPPLGKCYTPENWHLNMTMENNHLKMYLLLKKPWFSPLPPLVFRGKKAPQWMVTMTTPSYHAEGCLGITSIRIIGWWSWRVFQMFPLWKKRGWNEKSRCWWLKKEYTVHIYMYINNIYIYLYTLILYIYTNTLIERVA